MCTLFTSGTVVVRASKGIQGAYLTREPSLRAVTVAFCVAASLCILVYYEFIVARRLRRAINRGGRGTAADSRGLLSFRLLAWSSLRAIIGSAQLNHQLITTLSDQAAPPRSSLCFSLFSCEHVARAERGACASEQPPPTEEAPKRCSHAQWALSYTL